MKTLWLVMLSTLFLTGCIYTHPAPYGYSRHTVIEKPVYSRYGRHYYTPVPSPRFHYEEGHRHHHHPRSHRYW